MLLKFTYHSEIYSTFNNNRAFKYIKPKVQTLVSLDCLFNQGITIAMFNDLTP